SRTPRPARTRAGRAGPSRSAPRSPRCRHRESTRAPCPGARASATSRPPCPGPGRTTARALPPATPRRRRARPRRRPRSGRSPPPHAVVRERTRSPRPSLRIRARAGTPTRPARCAHARRRSAPPRMRSGGTCALASPLLSQPMAKDRQTAPWSGLLEDGRADGRLVREAREGPGEATLVDPPSALHPDVHAALARMGVEQLYSHQAEALLAATEGPTIVTTGTASGKSMCFNLPTLHVLCEQARARALYLYPTKALAQDQARALNSFGLSKRVRPAIYDGDTPREARADIRKRANVVLTNPDMLHVGILPNHGAWADLFANLAVVVIDEAHVYRGVFGSHVAGVLRRLRRIAAAYGTEPVFLMTSATIANPLELAERLTGLENVRLIEDDGSPAPSRSIAVWNPPLADEALGARRSAIGEAAELLARLVREGARTICFIKSRKGVELLSRLVKEDLQGAHAELAELVVPYRAGYTAQQRRELEGRLMRGELRAVITTDALELGIDIGALDAAVVVTFPGTVASLKQMWGRAGRSTVERRGNG